MRFTLKQAHKFGWKGLTAYSYSSKNDFKNASAAVFKVTGHHGMVKSKTSDRVYYVISGKGKFIIGNKHVAVKSTDVVIVPKNTPYDYKGKLKLFLVHVPAYNEKGEVRLEHMKGRTH